MGVTMADATVASLGGIEGLERLKSTQSIASMNRRARPPPIEVHTIPQSPRQTTQQANLQRQQSKGGIRSIFNRHKTEKVPTTPLTEEVQGQEASLNTPKQVSSNRTTSIPHTSTVTPTTPAKSMSRPSRINLRGRSVKEGKNVEREVSKPVTPSTRPTRSTTTWDPPPLFQAYPQAIKHAQLAASTLSADVILRGRNHKRNNSLTEYNPTATNEEREHAAAKKAEKPKSKHRRQPSDTISKAEWTQKIFVLVTSGYLLQYAGEGSFDRLPEKMMQLGKDSVAFASDVIPGKHWVLQISQSMDADGTPTSDSRSLLSRLTFRGGADYRRTATSLLLVLDSAEEMESWLVVMRREIESLGGKKYVPDIARQKSIHKIPHLEKRPSHRYLVQRDPEQFFGTSPPKASAIDHRPWEQPESPQDQSIDYGATGDWTQSSARPSLSHQSATNSFVSHDGQQLDDLRSSNRFSYMSSGQHTGASGQFSSPEQSPVRESSMSTLENVPPKISIEEVRPRPNASAINERRRSMQVMPMAAVENQYTPKYQRHSTYGPSITPNFSVPNSSSRRFSTNKPLGSVSNATVSRAESIMKGTRKTPPPAISIARPLSPVADNLSPLQEIESCEPAPKPSATLQQITASVIDIAPRSPLPSPSPIESTQTHDTVQQMPRRISNGYLEARDISNTQISTAQVPRRPNSMIGWEETSRAQVSVRATAMKLQSGDNLAGAPTLTKRHSLVIPPRHPLHNLPKKSNSYTQSSESSTHPVVANTKTKVLRRPSSMQIQNSSYSVTNTKPTSMAGIASPGLPRRTETQLDITPIKNVQTITTSPPPKSSRRESQSSIDRLGAGPRASLSARKLQPEDPKGLSNRRSMPFLAGGPPPAPPPNCALPPLPPIANGVGSKKIAVK